MFPVAMENMTAINNRNAMDTQLFQAATKGSIDMLNHLLDGKTDVLHQMTPIKNTVIHIAAKHGHLEFVKHVHSLCPKCLTQANSIGDTPFHVAARAGQTEMVRLLISYITISSVPAADVELGRAERVDVLRKINNKGNTPMHDAVRNNRFDVVKLLIEEDPQLLSLNNYAGESPLYVAVEKGEVEIVKEILQAAQYSHLGPNGRTALHVAIFHNRAVIAELLLEGKQKLATVADCNRRSPLHFATTLGLNGLIQLLLKYDTSTTYLLDKTGLAPIHIAALYGMIDTIEVFLVQCPDLKDLVDGQGRNILHLAIEGGEIDLVKYILSKQELEGTLNEKDNNGNTPLHLGTINFQPLTVNLLVKDMRVDWTELNNEGLSALAIAMSQNDERKQLETIFIRVTLLHAARPTWCDKTTSRQAIIRQRLRGYSIEWYKDKSNVLMVVAALVATVSFAAGFTLPGGYHQEKDQNQGMAVLAQEDLFKSFLFNDALCLFTSSVAAAFLMGVQFIDDLLSTVLLFTFAYILTAIALSSLTPTFLAGVGLTVTWLNREIIYRLISYLYIFHIVNVTFILLTLQHHFSFLYLSRQYVYFQSWLNQSCGFRGEKPRRSCENRLRDVSMLLHYKDDSQ